MLKRGERGLIWAYFPQHNILESLSYIRWYHVLRIIYNIIYSEIVLWYYLWYYLLCFLRRGGYAA